MRRSSGGGGSYPMSEVTEGLPRARGMPEIPVSLENAGNSFVSEVRRVTPQERDEFIASGGPHERSHFVPGRCVCIFSLLKLYLYCMYEYITLISRKLLFTVLY